LVLPLIYGFLLTNLVLPACSLTPAAEIRGVWLTNIDSDIMFHPKRLSGAIDTLAKLNFNTLYPTVWNWGYTLYPSPVNERVTGRLVDPEPGLQGRDILQEIVQQGQAKGMTVIPWFEFGFMAPAASELAKRHPDWLVQRRDGSKIWLEGKIHQRVWLNPLHPEVQQFISDLVLEIISRPGVKGIQLDDHFGYPAEFGYDSLTIKLYRQEHGGQLPPANYKERDWIQWRADKITAYMQQLRRAIKAKNPQAIVSLSPNPQQFSLEEFLLDWFRWQQLGLIDELIVQLYRDNQQDFRRELSQPELQTIKGKIPVGVGILAGVKGKLVPMKRIEQQVQATRDRNFAGVSFFFYESLWQMSPESPPVRQQAFKYLFPKPIKRI
jgi:uncharacterized lipoprotein YddW (UPF0748 family)